MVNFDESKKSNHNQNCPRVPDYSHRIYNWELKIRKDYFVNNSNKNSTRSRQNIHLSQRSLLIKVPNIN